jgi:hypothetical protein
MRRPPKVRVTVPFDEIMTVSGERPASSSTGRA